MKNQAKNINQDEDGYVSRERMIKIQRSIIDATIADAKNADANIPTQHLPEGRSW